jgi:microsomal prostaglandin-E synthase 2
LDYNKIPYKVVEVNPISKKEIKWSDYKKVPILTVDGEQMVDSSVIIDSLFQKMHPEISKSEDDEETKWRKWVDNHLVHLLSPNIYRNTSEALESFEYITTHGMVIVDLASYFFPFLYTHFVFITFGRYVWVNILTR